MKKLIALLTILSAAIAGFSEYRAIIVENNVRFEEHEDDDVDSLNKK